jgi:siroheme synthase-like protein
MVNLTGRRCVCVGAGRVAVRRVPAIVAAGGLVTVVAPVLSAAIEEMASSGAIKILRREYRSQDIDDAFLVLVATNDGTVNRSIADQSRASGAMVCVASQAELGDITFMATIRREALTIAIDTAASSPGLAMAMRRRVESIIPNDIEEVMRRIAEARAELKARLPDPVLRAAAWQTVVGGGDLDRALAGDRTAIARIRTTLGLDATT